MKDGTTNIVLYYLKKKLDEVKIPKGYIISSKYSEFLKKNYTYYLSKTKQKEQIFNANYMAQEIFGSLSYGEYYIINMENPGEIHKLHIDKSWFKEDGNYYPKVLYIRGNVYNTGIGGQESLTDLIQKWILLDTPKNQKGGTRRHRRHRRLSKRVSQKKRSSRKSM